MISTLDYRLKMIYTILHDTAANLTYTTSYPDTETVFSLSRASSGYANHTLSQLLFDSSSFVVAAYSSSISLIIQSHKMIRMYLIIRNLEYVCNCWNDDLLGSTTPLMLP